ncbi:MAG: 16S rRNA processing protein RimM [Rhodospirillales bacterium]|nr:MAG: 16S rRNA processing protein RimM [Rhodospirillales bacterium]
MISVPRVLMGVVEGAHGVQGLVKVRSFAAEPAAIAAYGPLECGDGKRFKARYKGMVRGNVLLSVEGVTDRDQAQALRGTELFVPRAALPGLDEEEDGFYHADLIGLEVRLTDGQVLGSVTGVADYGAGELLEVRLVRDRLTPSHESDTELNVNRSLKQSGRADSRSQSKPVNGFDFKRPALEDRGRTVLVPFTKAVVPEVNVAQGFVVVDPLPGLLDEPRKADEDMEDAD